MKTPERETEKGNRDVAEDRLLELCGSVETVVYHNDKNQYTVLEMNAGNENVTVVGAFPFVSVGEELHVYGKWSSHPSFGDQFKAEAFERSRPATTAAMLKYLSSGAVKGIGPATARRIIETFGGKALEIIENEPERLAQIKGITREKALEINTESGADGLLGRLWGTPGRGGSGVETIWGRLCRLHSGRSLLPLRRWFGYQLQHSGFYCGIHGKAPE